MSYSNFECHEIHFNKDFIVYSFSRYFNSMNTQIQWNSVITTTLVLFLKCRIARVVLILVMGNKEECSVSIKGRQHWL